ncbi:hypothetical protein LguiA_033081 [Lonicera macranthoides]
MGRGYSIEQTPKDIPKTEKVKYTCKEIRSKLYSRIGAKSEDLSRNEVKSEDLSRNGAKSKDLSRNDTESKYDELIINIEMELNGINPIQLSQRCIYRVPTTLRKLNEEAYTPRMVSIGPFHHGAKARLVSTEDLESIHHGAEARLISMEDLKNRYFKKFVQGSFVSLRKCIEFLKDVEGRAREFYDEVIYMDSNKFVHMLLVDACFILELLLKSHYPHFRDDEDTYVMSTPWLRSDLKLDLILLENQIPFFVLEGLYNLANATSSMQLQQLQSLQNLTLDFFKKYNQLDKRPNFESVKHFTDLILMLHRPVSPRPARRLEKFKYVYSVTELDEAGVKFQVSKKRCLLDVDFNKPVLEIPCFKLNDHTETLIRNLMALELCHYPSDSYIIDYIAFMDYLINTPKDVDLLVQNGILANWLGDSKAAARLFNKLCVNITVDDNNFFFFDICDDLNKYYEAPMHKRKATLRRDYFNTPWKTVSTIAAFVLLVLTFIQTVCSIISISGY